MKLTEKELLATGSLDSRKDLRIYHRLLGPWTEKKLSRLAVRLTGRRDVNVKTTEKMQTFASPFKNGMKVEVSIPTFYGVNEEFEQNLLRMEGALAHECGHILFSDFSLMGQVRSDESRAKNEVPVYAKDLDPTDEEQVEILHTLIKEMIKKRVEGNLFNSLEDAAIESAMYEAHPDIYGALIATREYINEREIITQLGYAKDLKANGWDPDDRYLLDHFITEIRMMAVIGYRKQIPTPLTDHFFTKKQRKELFWNTRIARFQAKTTKARLTITRLILDQLDEFIERKAQRFTQAYIKAILDSKQFGSGSLADLEQEIDTELTINVEVDPKLASMCPPPKVNSDFELDAPKDIQDKINKELQEEQEQEKQEEKQEESSGNGKGTEGKDESKDPGDQSEEYESSENSEESKDSEDTENSKGSEDSGKSSSSKEDSDQNESNQGKSNQDDSDGGSNTEQSKNEESSDNDESQESESSESENSDKNSDSGSGSSLNESDSADGEGDSDSNSENQDSENETSKESEESNQNSSENTEQSEENSEGDLWEDFYDSKEMHEELERQTRKAAQAAREALNKIKNQIEVEETKEFTQSVSKDKLMKGSKREALQSIADISPISDLHANVSISVTRSDQIKKAADTLEGRFAKDNQNSLKKSALKWARPMKQLLMYQGNTSIRKGLCNGNLNRTGLYRAKTDLKIFKKKTVGKEKKARFCTLIDCSGSMSGKKMINAIKAAYMLGEACKSIQVPISIYGHTTDNRGVRLYECVSYEDNKNRTCFDTLFKLSSKAGNRDGLAMFQCLTEMVRSSKQDEILIFLVISDGWPTYDNASLEEAAVDMQVIMEQFEKNYHVKSIGVGIGSECECVREIYKNALIVQNVEGLGDELLKILKNEILD